MYWKIGKSRAKNQGCFSQIESWFYHVLDTDWIFSSSKRSLWVLLKQSSSGSNWLSSKSSNDETMLLFITVIKHHDQNKIGVESWSLTVPYNSSSSKAVRAGTHTGQEPGGGSWCRGHGRILLTGLLSMACLVCFPSFLPSFLPSSLPPSLPAFLQDLFIYFMYMSTL